MSETYYVKNKNRIIGILDLPKLNFELDKKYDGPLPYMLYPIEENKEYIPKDKDVYNFIKSRLVQEDNQVIGVIAKDMGLNNYAPIEMIKQTLGMCLNDFLWIVPIENNMDYYTTHMRAVPKKYFPQYG